MKTSINVPDWLHAEAQALHPDTPFGVIVRDALLISLQTWRGMESRTAVERALKMQLRLETAKNAREAELAAKAAQARKAARRRAAKTKPVPGVRPAHRPASARMSETMAAKQRSRSAASTRSPAPSPPK